VERRPGPRVIEASTGYPLYLLFRIVVLRGARRAEAVGFRWSGTDLDAGFIRVERPVLLIGAEVTEGRPKSGAGERLIGLDEETIRLLREHRTVQLRARMKAGPARPGRMTTSCSARTTARRGSRTT